MHDPEGTERRGRVTSAGPDGDRRWWVQWFGPGREPTYSSLAKIKPTWRFYADRGAWLDATAHLDQPQEPTTGDT